MLGILIFREIKDKRVGREESRGEVCVYLLVLSHPQTELDKTITVLSSQILWQELDVVCVTHIALFVASFGKT